MEKDLIRRFIGRYRGKLMVVAVASVLLNLLVFSGSIYMNPLKYYRNNTAASRSLIESAVACRVPHFVLCSTATVYGTASQTPLPELGFLWPNDPYGTSSLVTETILGDAATAYGLNTAILRCGNVAGADPHGRCGPSPTMSGNAVKMAIDTVLGKRDGVVVPCTDQTPDGSAVQDYIHVGDLASAHVSALETLLEGSDRNFRLNCGYGYGFSAREIVAMVEKITNVRIKRLETPLEGGEPPMRVLDNRAIMEKLRWTPAHGELEEIVRSTYRWEMRHPRIVAA